MVLPTWKQQPAQYPKYSTSGSRDNPQFAIRNPQLLGRRRFRRDHLIQGIAQGMQTLRCLDWPMVGTLDIKRVDRHATLGTDAGKRDVEAMLGNGPRESIEQADLVAGLHFHDRALHRNLVIDFHRR